MSQSVLLINTNVAKPPVSPVGLEYVAQSLIEAGIPVEVLDFSFEVDWKASLRRRLTKGEPLLVGLTVRNTDDCSFATRKWFLPWISQVVAELRSLTDARIVLGGGAFSIMPEVVLQAVQADFGIEGDGEEALLAMAKGLAKGQDITGLPNLVYRCDGKIVRNPRVNVDLRRLPTPRRRVFDNRKYQQFGAMVGVETKRGCSQKCTFCADPVAKGKKVRLRPPEIVAQEFCDLVDRGVNWFHLCDSEFNLPLGHAKDICREMIRSGLADRTRWYTYCAPIPFDAELASLMKKSGCAGINFGVDSLCDEQLQRLGKGYTSADVAQLVSLLQKEGVNFIFDMLVGAPGETPETVAQTINRAKELDVPLVGIAAGVRVYQHTALWQAIANGSIKEGLHPGGNGDYGQPLFYLSPALGNDALPLINRLADNDPRFLVLAAPEDEGSYNYAGDIWLSDLIEKGARGAYWDIIRQNPGG